MLKPILLVISVLVTFSSALFAQTREQYIEQSKSTYIPAAKNRALQLNNSFQTQINASGNSTISTDWDGDEPKFYGGNWAGEVIANAEDSWKIITDDFWDCFDIDIDIIGWHWRKGLRWKVSYFWPVQTVHSHHYWQNRYLSPIIYSAWDLIPTPEELYYPTVENLMVPFYTALASQKAYQGLLFGGYPNSSSPVVAPGTGNLNLNRSGNSNFSGQLGGRKISSGAIGADSHLDYYIGPTGFQAIWGAFNTYFPLFKAALSWFGCLPPAAMPIPLTSDDPAFFALTRDWTLGYGLFFRDQDLRGDILRLNQDPAACTKIDMATGAIPNDMFQKPSVLQNPISGVYPNLLTSSPMNNVNNRNAYSRVCTRNIGTVLPFTTYRATATHDLVHAQINFEKAIRFAWGFYLSTIRTNGFPRDRNGYVQSNPRNWSGNTDIIGFYNLDKANDKIQFTYHSRAPRGCFNLGQLGPKFAGANTRKKPGEDGLYSIIHWKRFQCERWSRTGSPWG
jgi:hypothetical protein